MSSVDPKKFAALILLTDDPTAWRLIVSWPNVNREGLPKNPDKRRSMLVERWARLAGLREIEVRKEWEKLFGNGFISEDGGVDEHAEKFVQSLVQKKLPRSMRSGGQGRTDVPPARGSRTGRPPDAVPEDSL